MAVAKLATKAVAKKRPAGVPETVRVFAGAAGHDWHVEQEWREGQAGPGTALSLRVKAPDGTLVDTFGHTFTQEELAAPDFDAVARVAQLVDDAVARADRIEIAKGQLDALDVAWRADK